jgi:hypothetical protein
MASQNQTTEQHFWAWLADMPLDPCFYGQIILTVRAGAVVEYEQRSIHRPPRQQPPPGGETDRNNRKAQTE